MPRSSSANSQDVDVEVDVQPVKVKSKRRHMTNDSDSKRQTTAKDINPHKDKKRKVQKMRETDSSSLAENETGESSSADSSDLKVMTLKKKVHGGRLYTKRFYCLFCSKPFSKMARHLESKHKDKPEVARAVTFPKGSKERRIQFSLLRNKGNRVHNNQVLKKGKGVVIPCQQSSVPVNPSDYMHCVNCEAYLKRKSLWRHMQRCYLQKKVKGLKPGKTRVQALCAYTLLTLASSRQV
jgi:hypothetical protein